MVKDQIKWGILAPGRIAQKFVEAIQNTDHTKLIAVGSRTQKNAEIFADKFKIPNVYGSYEELVKDPEVDVIYIASPHVFHKDHTLLCLKHQKAVLCEKPFAINVNETDRMIQMAHQNQIFLMEGMWTRFFPAIQKLNDIIHEGIIGEIKSIHADFGIKINADPEGRELNPQLGGGALLDLGIYPLSLISMVLGLKYSTLTSTAYMGTTNVDEQSVTILTYPEGTMAVMMCSFGAYTGIEAKIGGTKGNITVHFPWFFPNKLSIRLNWNDYQEFNLPYKGNGYVHEVEHVNQCLQQSLLESPLMPLKETHFIMQTMDQIRAQWKFVYPCEKL